MPTITLSDEVFAELKSLAEPFVDTPASLIATLIHREVVRKGLLATKLRSIEANENALMQDPLAHEDLAHTRLLAASIDGHDMYRPKWNGLMAELHVLALKQLQSFDALQRATSARIRPGRFEVEGFKYIPEADLSIQGVQANLAWDYALKLARAIKVSIRALFEWRQKESALHPGQRGLLHWSPAESTPARPSAHVRSPRLVNPAQAADFRKRIIEIRPHA